MWLQANTCYAQIVYNTIQLITKSSKCKLKMIGGTKYTRMIWISNRFFVFVRILILHFVVVFRTQENTMFVLLIFIIYSFGSCCVFIIIFIWSMLDDVVVKQNRLIRNSFGQVTSFVRCLNRSHVPLWSLQRVFFPYRFFSYSAIIFFSTFISLLADPIHLKAPFLEHFSYIIISYIVLYLE